MDKENFIKRADNYSHIILSSMEAMIESAGHAGLTQLSVTEHISQFAFMKQKVKFASVHETGRMFSSFQEYLKEFPKASDFKTR